MNFETPLNEALFQLTRRLFSINLLYKLLLQSKVDEITSKVYMKCYSYSCINSIKRVVFIGISLELHLPWDQFC